MRKIAISTEAINRALGNFQKRQLGSVGHQPLTQDLIGKIQKTLGSNPNLYIKPGPTDILAKPIVTRYGAHGKIRQSIKDLKVIKKMEIPKITAKALKLRKGLKFGLPALGIGLGLYGIHKWRNRGKMNKEAREIYINSFDEELEKVGAIDPQRKPWIKRHPAIFGALLGGGLLAAGLTASGIPILKNYRKLLQGNMIAKLRKRFYPPYKDIVKKYLQGSAVISGTGAGIGAGIGALTGREKR